MAEDLSLRVLVLAQFGRDGELLRTFLQRHAFSSQIVANSEEFFNELERGAATALITEESLTLPIKNWSKRMEMQPTWSDFPLIVLISASGAAVSPSGLAALRVLGNVTLVERPIRQATSHLLTRLSKRSTGNQTTWAAFPAACSSFLLEE